MGQRWIRLGWWPPIMDYDNSRMSFGSEILDERIRAGDLRLENQKKTLILTQLFRGLSTVKLNLAESGCDKWRLSVRLSPITPWPGGLRVNEREWRHLRAKQVGRDGEWEGAFWLSTDSLIGRKKPVFCFGLPLRFPVARQEASPEFLLTQDAQRRTAKIHHYSQQITTFFISSWHPGYAGNSATRGEAMLQFIV